jgi:hypothetical protein
VPGPAYWCPITAQPLSPALSRTPPSTPDPTSPWSRLSVTPAPRRRAPPPSPVRATMTPPMPDSQGRCRLPHAADHRARAPFCPSLSILHTDAPTGTPLPLSFSVGLKGSPCRRVVSSFSALYLSLHVESAVRDPSYIHVCLSSQSNHQSTPVGDESRAAAAAASSPLGEVHPPELPVIDRPPLLTSRHSPVLQDPPSALSTTTGAPLATTECICFPSPSRLPVDNLISVSSVPVTLPGASPVFPQCSPGTPCRWQGTAVPPANTPSRA